MHYRKSLGRQFWQLWAAVAASSLGDGVFSVALPLLGLQFTRNPLSISGIFLATRIPAVLASLPFGTLADRINRRKLMVAVESARFILLAAFTLLTVIHRDNLALIYAVAFLSGGLNVAFDVVGAAAIPAMVSERDLVRANAHLLNAEMTAENLVGQAIGGAAFALSRSVPFLANAVTLGASAALLTGAVPDAAPAATGTSARRDLIDGMRWFIGNSLVRQLTFVIASLAFCQGMVFGLLALYARERLGLTDTGFGLLLAVASVGTLIGGVTASSLYESLGFAKTLFFSALIFGAAYPILGLTRSPLVAGAALLAQEGAVILGNTATRSLRQQVTPMAMQGRAASANTIIVLSFVPLGGLLGGAIADSRGLVDAFVAAGVIQLLLLLVTGPRLYSLVRRLNRRGKQGAGEGGTGAALQLDRSAVPDTAA